MAMLHSRHQYARRQLLKALHLEETPDYWEEYSTALLALIEKDKTYLGAILSFIRNGVDMPPLVRIRCYEYTGNGAYVGGHEI